MIGLSPTIRMRMPPTMKAAITAIRGHKRSHASLVMNSCFVVSALYFVLRPSNKAQSTKHKALMSPRHQQSDLFQGRFLRIDFSRDSSFMNDQQTIRQTRHFLELGRNEQD